MAQKNIENSPDRGVEPPKKEENPVITETKEDLKDLEKDVKKPNS